ncbi:MAG: 50S ribosomal protein L29 [Candidatus Moranbacteria bacterium]|jgi:ribosomal protein L29|nr:50S ribosomal protein L29 [Candidatus Moranbacteria bacterium]MBP9801153.1 50S ribosomal protein L29 [Candidatus Moranbacteria bacterium]
MKTKELREKTEGEQKKLLHELAQQTRELRFKIAAREETKHHTLRLAKKDIARLKTLLGESEQKLD